MYEVDLRSLSFLLSRHIMVAWGSQISTCLSVVVWYCVYVMSISIRAWDLLLVFFFLQGSKQAMAHYHRDVR